MLRPVWPLQAPDTDQSTVDQSKSTVKIERGRTGRSKDHQKAEAEDGTWPASLRRYLQRAFDNCNKGQGSRQHEQLEKALHRIVTDAMADNSMLTTDWDNEPLPRCGVRRDNSNEQ